MGEDDREGHEGGGFVGGVPKHHPLVPGPAAVHAERDVGGLAVDARENRAGLGVEAEVGVGVADPADGAAHDVRDVHVGRGRDLARHESHPRGHKGLARHTCLRIGAKNGVEDRVGDLVGDLVGMALGHRLRGEDVT